jgi:UDP-N-acetylmuramoyl-L-alanyl-D-glutamate--2,6-diaminopimelate ligase
MKNQLVKAVRKVLPKSALKPVEKAYRKGRVGALRRAYGNPAEGLKIIAVTGTNGKTTTCMFINEMLKVAGHKTAMFTTALTEVDGESQPNLRHTTMPVTAEIQQFFKQAKARDVEFVTMEVTSMGLDQHKLDGTPIEVAVVTNLSQEHLDYHGTMEKYAAAKARLVSDFKPGFVVLNEDDEWYDYFAGKTVGKLFTFGKKAEGESQITLGKDGSFKLGKTEVKLQLPGEFNIYNAAAAGTVGMILGLDSQDVKNGLESLAVVPGRMEPVNAGQDFKVLVDYAVTPDAIAKALQALRPLTKGKLMIVFGATGDRDKTKRPAMGEAAAKYADRIFLTDDETYTEDGDAIRAAVRQGIEKAGGAGKTTEVADRRKAIKTAFTEAKTGDTVIITGLGHENYRNMGGQKMPWDDRDIARELLKEL